MADIGKWLEALIGPQLAGLVGGGGPKAPVAPVPAVPAGPPPIAPGAVDTSFEPINVLDNGPKLNDLIAPPVNVAAGGMRDTPQGPMWGGEGTVPPRPGLAGLPDGGQLPPELSAPDEMMAGSPQMPVNIDPALYNVPTIAPPAAIAAPIAARKKAAAPVARARPLSVVDVVGSSKPAQGVQKFSRPPRLLTPNAPKPKPKPRPYKWSGKGVDWSKNNLMKR